MEAEGFQSGKILKILNPQTIQFMEFSRPEYWSGQLFPSPEDLPNPGIRGSSQPRDQTQVSHILGGFFTN